MPSSIRSIHVCRMNYRKIWTCGNDVESNHISCLCNDLLQHVILFLRPLSYRLCWVWIQYDRRKLIQYLGGWGLGGGGDYKLSCISYEHILGPWRVNNQPWELHLIVVCNPTTIKYTRHKRANSGNMRNILVLITILNNLISVSGRLV